MSKERQRARAAREAERHKAKPKATRPDETKPKPQKTVTSDKKRQPVYRQRRHAPLPVALKLFLAAFWLIAVTLILLFVPTWTARIGFIAIATMLLPLIAVIVRDPSRRYR